MTTGGAAPPAVRRLFAAFRALVAVGLTALLVWQADASQVFAVAAGADWRWIALAVALVLLDRTLMAYRWMVLLCALTPGTRPPFPAVVRVFFTSTFVGSFLPGIGGDLYRAYSLSRLRVSAVESAASVLMDRALGVLAMVLVAVTALVFARTVVTMPGVLPTILIAGAGCALAAAGVYSERVASAAHRLAAALPGRQTKTLGAGLVDAVRRYAHHHTELTTVLAASVGVQIIRVLQALCLGAALGMSAPVWIYFVFVPLIVLVMQIPVTVMGLGTGQFAFDLFFGQAGVPSAESLALSILFVALGVVGSLPGGVLFLRGGARAPGATRPGVHV